MSNQLLGLGEHTPQQAAQWDEDNCTDCGCVSGFCTCDCTRCNPPRPPLLTELTITLLPDTALTLEQLTSIHNQQFPDETPLTQAQYLAGVLGQLLAAELVEQLCG